MSRSGPERYLQVIEVVQQPETVVEDADLIEYEPEVGEGGQVVYELVEFAQGEDLRPGSFEAPKFRCTNRLCKRENVAYNTKLELDKHNEMHIEQYRNSICPVCNKELANATKLDVHIELRHTPRHFTCDQCGKVFRSKDNLRLHMTHHRKYFFVECRACGRGYKSIQSLRYHLRQHFEHHQCETCGKVFEHKKLLVGHVAAMHNQELQVNCHYCTRTFARSDVRDAHEREIHKNGTVGSHFKCNECGQSFDLRDDLMSHKILNHFSGVIHTCEECGKNFKKKSLLDLHMNVHRKKTISCEVCKQMFTFVTGLNKHRKLNRCKGPPSESPSDVLTKEEIARMAKQQLLEITVNPRKDQFEEEMELKEEPKEEVKPQMTTTKRKVGRKPKELKKEPAETFEEELPPVLMTSSGRVIKRKLPMALPTVVATPKLRTPLITFMCDICGARADSKATLMSHLTNHVSPTRRIRHSSDAKEKRFECATCGKRYLTAHLLAIHAKSHANLREYKCAHEGCRFETNSPYDLNNHVKRMHNSSKPFSCVHCDKKFKRRCDMLNHTSSVHSEVKTYVKCPICGKIILERGLQSHLINRHSEKAQLKPFECGICGKRERYERALQRHIDAVHEPKDRGVLYQCPDCPAAFYRRREMNVHSFEHFTGEVHECVKCGNKYKSKKELTNHEYSHRETEYPCSVCKRVFRTKSGLGKHLRKHGKAGEMDGDGEDESEDIDATVVNENEIVYEEYEILEEAEQFVIVE